MQVQHLYIIFFQKGSAGEHKPPKKSAKGLFFKYADRPGTDSVTWYHVGMGRPNDVPNGKGTSPRTMKSSEIGKGGSPY